ncbi:hypothetical protein DFP72DRAFT_1173273 [Ephemerocybe angulata]|uniref:Uncharacterized protein n=1 Tax=Ephemerocybe angulata TaxID=980116 RepID=A0A8H6M1M6_9AGAR|nr:hypothetical protein DFP72DRAFT_1173273 [Tulosesus angulatus]
MTVRLSNGVTPLDMDFKSEDIRRVVDAKTYEYTSAMRNVMLICYYLSTYDLEITKIWPQPTWKLGRLLFLGMRYSNVLAYALACIHSTGNHAKLGVRTCSIVRNSAQALEVLNVTCAEVTFWICLYALLGGGRKCRRILGVAFLIFFLPIQILDGMWRFQVSSIPLSQAPIPSALGYPCAFEDQVDFKLYAITGFIGMARSLLVLSGTLIVQARWASPSGTESPLVVSIIRREGLGYYLSVTVLYCSIGLSINISSIQHAQTWDIVDKLCKLAYPIFADRLLLRMQTVDNPEAQDVVSALIFDLSVAYGPELDLGTNERADIAGRASRGDWEDGLGGGYELEGAPSARRRESSDEVGLRRVVVIEMQPP